MSTHCFSLWLVVLFCGTSLAFRRDLSKLMVGAEERGGPIEDPTSMQNTSESQRIQDATEWGDARSVQDGMPAECTEILYGWDNGNAEKGLAPRCRCDHFGSSRGILDRFAKDICCAAFDLREHQRAKEHVEAKQLKNLTDENFAMQQELAAELAPGQLTIKNIKGHSLPNMNVTWTGAGKTDAFAKIWLTAPDGTSEQAQTPPVDSCLDPEWDWQHTFEIASSDAGVGWSLSLSIWDYDSLLAFAWDGHDYIGDINILFRKMPPGTLESYSHAIMNDKKEEQGTVSFDMVWEPMLEG